MNASIAREITELARKQNEPWNKLFIRIKEKAKQEKNVLEFDEEKEKVKFKEHRTEVKSKLENLGYNVSYSRVRNSDNYYGTIYHNKYVIEW